ncbi:MAG: sulfatase [Candidatus Hydrogenedentes bacterium]|nr:sulfatase [Candidatus Hydrogenedentota bacterium]
MKDEQGAESMRRRTFLGLTAATLALGAHADPARHGKPNIVFAFSDEHRWQSMGCSEMPGLRTPNMTRLAAEGTMFTHCISNAPVCSPYRGMLMTGRWPHQQGVTDNGLPLDPNRPTLGKAFQAAGYRTGYVGKWHLGGVRAEPFGFDESLIWTDDNTHWDKSEYHPREGEPVRPKGYNARLMTTQALDFIGKNDERPFFLMLSWNPPHSNFLDAPDEKKALYPPGSLPWRENVPEAVRNGEMKDGEIWSQSTWPYCQGYHAHISAIDDEIGRLLVCLEGRGIDHDTIVVYTSDHGSMMGSHGVGGKRQPYEESIRVPFFVRWPGSIPKGRTCDALFGVPDLMPTLCGLAGLAAPDSCAGRDLSRAMLDGRDPESEAQPIMHISKENASGGERHPAPLFRGLRTERYTYAVREDGPWLLFDNREDPFQMANRVDDSALADVKRKLHAQLAVRLRETGDPFVSKETG